MEPPLVLVATKMSIDEIVAAEKATATNAPFAATVGFAPVRSGTERVVMAVCADSVVPESSNAPMVVKRRARRARIDRWVGVSVRTVIYDAIARRTAAASVVSPRRNAPIMRKRITPARSITNVSGTPTVRNLREN